MNTETRTITVTNLDVEVVRKAIKNLHLGVYPPYGRVRVAVPWAVSDASVRLAVIGKLGWIRRQRARFEAQPRQSKREMVSGESHYFLGQRYRLNMVIQKGPAHVVIRQKRTLDLVVREGSDTTRRENVLLAWYRLQLKTLIPPLLKRWEGEIGAKATAWGVKRMKTKWGTCNIKARRIWLNLELAKKPVHSLEYVLVHELVHLLERQHNDRFKSLMDQFLPRWRFHRDELNRSPIRHESWNY